MAIIIPSKNIYDMNNPKIRDNVIDNVSVEQTVVSPSNDYETPIYNEKFDDATLLDTDKQNWGVNRKTSDDGGSYGYWLAYSKIININYYNITFQIPKIYNNLFIDKVFVGYDIEGGQEQIKVPRIKYTVYFEKQEFSSDMSATFNQGTEEIYSFGDISKTNETEAISGHSSNFDFITEYEYAYTPTYGEGIFTGSPSNPNKVVLEIPSESFGNILDESILDDTNNDYYTISNLRILGGYEQSLLGSWDGGTIGYPETKQITFEGTTTKYTAKQLEITIYGNTVGIDLTDGTVTYGSGNKPYTMNGNELLQDSAKVGEIALSKHLGEKVLGQYARGKETATLLCSIGDYYDNVNDIIAVSEKGSKVDGYAVTARADSSFVNAIMVETTTPYPRDVRAEVKYTTISGSIGIVNIVLEKNKTSKLYSMLFVEEIASVEIISVEALVPMSFQWHDEVIPYILGADGKDHPMSTNQNGSAKVFEVIGSNIFYDGAVWQELALQEKN